MAGFFNWPFGRSKKSLSPSSIRGSIASPRPDTDAGSDLQNAKADERMIELSDPRYEAYAAARRSYWTGIGIVDSDVIAYMISPQFSGAPAWPTTRQSFVIVRREHSLIIASDGLSDLFVGTNISGAGFGSEVYIEVAGMQAAPFDEVRTSWAFSLIENFARNLADWGGINNQIERYGVTSSEMPAPEAIEKSWISDEETVGILIGLPPEERAIKLRLDAANDILMLPITLITPAELAFISKGGAAARAELTRLLIDASVGAISDLGRRSVVNSKSGV